MHCNDADDDSPATPESGKTRNKLAEIVGIIQTLYNGNCRLGLPACLLCLPAPCPNLVPAPCLPARTSVSDDALAALKKRLSCIPKGDAWLYFVEMPEAPEARRLTINGRSKMKAIVAIAGAFLLVHLSSWGGHA